MGNYAILAFMGPQWSRPTRANGARRQPASFQPLAVVLAVAAGAMDAACFTQLGQVFAGVMTGNLTLIGLAAATRSASLASHVAVALLGYVTGTAFGAFVARLARDARRLTPVVAVLLVELAALAGFTVGWILTGGLPVGAAQFGLLAAATLAMGLQAAAVGSTGTKLSTTYLTGTLTTVISGLVTGARSGAHTRWSVAVLAVHAAGAAAAAVLILVAPVGLPALPDIALLGVLTVLLTRAATREDREPSG